MKIKEEAKNLPIYPFGVTAQLKDEPGYFCADTSGHFFQVTAFDRAQNCSGLKNQVHFNGHFATLRRETLLSLYFQATLQRAK